MRLKLDENLGGRGVDLLTAMGHDVATVASQRMCGEPDTTLIEVCAREGRCLVTLDLDFANPLRFEPGKYAGIAVLRLPGRASSAALNDAMATLAAGLRSDSIAGRLWIIEAGRIRQHQPVLP